MIVDDSLLLRFRHDQKYCVIDTETEGLNLYNTKSWQVSFFLCQGNEIISKHNYFPFFKDLNIPRELRYKIHFDPNEYQQRAIPLKDFLDVLTPIIYDPEYVIIGHNILGFDIYCLNILRKELGLKPDYSFVNRVIDTMCLAKAWKLKENCPNSVENVLSWQYKLLSVKQRLGVGLTKIAKDLGVEADETKAHDALYDIQMTWGVFQKLIHQMDVII